MKISFAHLVFGETGGIERASRDLAEQLAVQGHSVLYHCTERQSAPPPGVAVEVHRVPHWPNALRIATFALSASRAAARNRDIIMHAHGVCMSADVVTAHSCHRAGLAALKRIPRTSSRPGRNFGASDLVRLRLEHHVLTRHRFRMVIAVSGGVRDELMREYGVAGEDIAVIPNGVDLSRFDPENREKQRADVLARLGIQPDAFVLLFVGNEFHRKGLQESILALHDLNNPQVHLLVAGGDDPVPYRQLAQKCGLGDRVHFLGKVTGIERICAASDLFVFPTAYEAFSVAMIEAAGAGLPLLLTRVNGAAEVLTDGVEGMYIDRERASIAAAIKTILDDRVLLARMGSAARKKANEFGWPRITRQVLDVYDRVQATRRQSTSTEQKGRG
jgi:UDP-glucose:(heptosyl)LPS alpha-1,3-glucosyltransferase